MRMRMMGAVALALCLFSTPCRAQELPAPQKNTVLFKTDFEGADVFKGWSGPAKAGPGFQSCQSLFVERTADSSTHSTLVTIRLPVEQLRGCLVCFSGMVKAENVSNKLQSWNGVKFMAPVVTGDGQQIYPHGEIGVGTFDWTRVLFSIRMPQDAAQCSLYLGIEGLTGKVWFDDIKVTVRNPPSAPKPQRQTAGPVYKGHNLPRLRGVMVKGIDEQGFQVLGQEWNANLIRWEFVRPKTLVKTESFDMAAAAYDRWLDGELERLDRGLALCEKYGILAVVIHPPLPLEWVKSDEGIFNNAQCQQKFVEVWQRIAKRYKGVKAVWGYDLLNEPVENAVAENLADWQELAERAAKAVRAIDPDHAIIVEPASWGKPPALQELEPLDVPNVVYSVHMYAPNEFTHQGVELTSPGGVSRVEYPTRCRYPGEINGKMWDKTALERYLKPVVDFQKRYGVHIYIGEFSAIRWAPDHSAYRYLKDLIDIFEENGWDWSYHAFREWQGWSVEHGMDQNSTSPSAETTQREKLLREWFSKNKKAE